MQSFWVNLNGGEGGDRFGRYYQRLGGRGSWVLRWSALAAGIVFVVPFLLLALLAIMTFVAVFFVLSMSERAMNWFGSLFSGTTQPAGDDGRRNVTIVRVDDGGV